MPTFYSGDWAAKKKQEKSTPRNSSLRIEGALSKS